VLDVDWAVGLQRPDSLVFREEGLLAWRRTNITVWYQDPACLVVGMCIYSILDVEDLACCVG
jgi:hypothetical protein